MSSTWTNWARQQRCAPGAIERPADEGELRAAVARAAARGVAVRATGTGHSFNDCACTDGLMLDLSRMQRVLDADRESGLVTVEGGIKLHRLCEQLAAHGLALENQGDIDAQSITGATATGTHGTGVRFGNLSSRIEGMRLILASGEVVELSAGDDPDALRAARVSLGALGVVSAVTIGAVPAYTLHRRDAPRPLDEVLAELDELVDRSDHFEFFIFPYTRTALTRTCRRSDETPDPPPAWRRRVQEDLIENRALEMVCRIARAAPRVVPAINRLSASAVGVSEVADRSHRVFATRRTVRFTELEYGIPRAHAREALMRTLEAIERRRLPVPFPIEVRFAAADDALLSVAHDRESCHISVHQYEGMEYETCFRAVEEVMGDYAGRPHWGKRHYQTAATLRSLYPGWDRFQAVRARLDPGGAFENAYVRRTLGPVGVPAAT